MPVGDIHLAQRHLQPPGPRTLQPRVLQPVHRVELRDEPQAVAKALGTSERKTIKGLMWGMRKNPSGWSRTQRL